MKNPVLIASLVILALIGFFVWNLLSNQKESTKQETLNQTPKKEEAVSDKGVSFANPKKSAHYESNTPAHGVTLAGVPMNVVIDFNFDLAKPSEIKILKDSQDLGEGETIIDKNKSSMRRRMNPDASDGLYTVEYKACWPDGSCHDGSFQFAVDQGLASSFDDQTNKKEVTIKLSQIKFNPQNIKVSKRTKVTWINDDEVEHYINTDSHPSHSFYPDQNSKLLKKGDKFSLIFDTPGIYPYHCSAHASSMTGTLLVVF